MDRDRQRASAEPLNWAMFVPSTFSSPDVGWSTPPIRFSSVVFPEPEGPMSATKAPSGTDTVRPSRTRTSSASRRYTLTTLRTSTDAMALLRCRRSMPGELHPGSVLQTRGGREHQAFAAHQPLADLD